MLNPEDASKRLKPFRVPPRYRERVADLRSPLREIGLGLLGRNDKGKEIGHWQKSRRVKVQSGAMLDALPAEERREIFMALCPTVADHVEAAWKLQGLRPFQSSYSRRAFRSPRNPAATLEVRVDWLNRIAEQLGPYHQDLQWIAAWTPYFAEYVEGPLGVLMAAAIDQGGPEADAVYQTLVDSASGEHEIGAMGRHVTTALLCASRPDGWAFVERLLLAAQRQEGLRQTILESVDEAHPEAFRRMLRLILEHDLLRFSAAIRAVDVWLGFGLEADTPAVAKSVVSRLLDYLDSPAARAAALVGPDPESLYLALWATAFEDAHAVLEPAAALLKGGSVEQRFVTAYLLQQLALPDTHPLLLAALEDEDLRVSLAALDGLPSGDSDEDDEDGAPASDQVCEHLFEALERIISRCPDKPRELAKIGWDWMTVTVDRSTVAARLLPAQGKRSPERLIPYLSMLDPYRRSAAVDCLAKMKRPTEASRKALFALAGDSAEYVRARALEALKQLKIQDEEAVQLETLLTRKAADLRQGLLLVLLNQPDPAALGSADRLLAARHAMQRRAGLELLQQMTNSERAAEACRDRARAYRDTRDNLSEEEAQLIETFLEPDRETWTLDDALGLMDPKQQTAPTPPRDLEATGIKGLLSRLLGKQPFRITSEASLALVKSLDAVVHKHREAEVTLKSWDGSDRVELLGNIKWGFPLPAVGVTAEEESARLPCRELWEGWWAERPDTLRDPDGFELLRAIVSLTALKGSNPRAAAVVTAVLTWMLRLHPPQDSVSFLLAAAETSLAQVPESVLTRLPKPDMPWDRGWRDDEKRMGWIELTKLHRSYFPDTWSPDDHARFWGLLRWIDEPGFGQPRFRQDLTDAAAALAVGGATEADVYDLLLGPRPETHYWHHGFDELRQVSSRKPVSLFAVCPQLPAIVQRCRERIIEVELQRGDLPTAASRAAHSLRYAGGSDALIRLVRAFGSNTFARGYSRSDSDKAAVFSHLIRATFPEDELTPARFAEQVAEARLSEKRLVEVAFYAPQWAAHVERALGWPEFAEAVWWIHAHTKDQQWSVDQEIKDVWTAQVSSRTPLPAQSLVDGAVDVAWFQRVYQALGPERWSMALDQGAKYASGGGGHKRAQLFADAMLGRADREKLLKQIEEKRNQDALRSLGLLPVKPGEEGRLDVLARYKLVQEFVRGSKQFGSLRQVSEKLAAAISLENLARTAGYPDPIRLEWAMEAEAIQDLAAGPVSATVGEVTATLSINEWGEPDLSFVKSGKPLKALPPAAKKDPAVAALVERRREVERQASRMRQSLESAMCRGDRFIGAEIRELCAHPVLAPMLRGLVFLGEGKCGYPIEDGASLRGLNDTNVSLSDGEALQIAHPFDLFNTGQWDGWQQDCFRRERIQPFKQVFRELYVLTDAERSTSTGSQRYAGHQVNGKQAMALLGKRGWISNPEDGDVRRTFHDCGLTAWVRFDYGFTTPAEVEGLTVDTVGFSRRGEWQPLPLEEIPPRVFSEVMRDLDLVVSVAHQGGVDPEATASTVEMRAALIRETCTLLKLDNVELKSAHAVISGKLGTYSLHLGSGIVHRQPGGHLCIVPVHSQHRGRLFLPFADNDPRTAEVMSKTLLLAKDHEIKDPTILSQILASK